MQQDLFFLCALVIVLMPNTPGVANEPELRRLPPVNAESVGTPSTWPILSTPPIPSVSSTLPAVPTPSGDPATKKTEPGKPTATGMDAKNKDVVTEKDKDVLDAESIELPDGVQEDLTWYEWVLPNHWYIPKPWDATFELGIDATDGNSETLTFRTGADFKRKIDWSDLRIDVNYVRGSANRVETKNHAQLGVHHDWLFKDSRWSLFGVARVDYDQFRAFDARLTLNSGAGYRFIDKDATTFKGRAGAGTSREFNGPNDRWEPEAVFGIDFDHKLSERQKIRAVVDYFPNWYDFNDYRMRSKFEWQVLLDKATNMNLKLRIVDRYDSTPYDRRPNDLDYSLLLLWEL